VSTAAASSDTPVSASAPTSRLERSRTFHALSVRNFRLYVIGQIVSFSGTNAQNVANGWLVLQLTNSGAALGLIMALQFAPTLLSGAWAVNIVRNVDRMRLMKFTQCAGAAMALTTFALVVTDSITVWMLAIIALVVGVLACLDQIARQLLVGEMVGDDRLPNALGINNMLFGVARIAGPAVAGVVIGLAGTAWCFALNAVSYIALLTALQMMRPSENHTFAHVDENGRSGTTRDVLRIPAARAGLLAMVVVGLFTYQFWVTLPLLIHSTFKASATMLGLLFACMSAGSVAGGLLAGRRRNIGRNELVFACAAFGLTTMIVGLSPSLPIAFVATFVMGMAYTTFLTWGNSTLQLSVERHLRTRVIALRTSALPGLTAAGSPLIGIVGQHFGTTAAFAVGGVSGVVAAVAVASIWTQPSPRH
jgi:predicted MFS family arabinose efflux permease